MWLIIVLVIVWFIWRFLRFKEKANDEKFRLIDKFRSYLRGYGSEDDAKAIAMGLYKYSFYRMRRKPYNFIPLRIDNEFFKQAKHFNIYKFILGVVKSQEGVFSEVAYMQTSAEASRVWDYIAESTIKFLKEKNL